MIVNEILHRWQGVLDARRDATAVFLPDRARARTFAGIEAESALFSKSLAAFGPGAVVSMQVPNCAEWIALLIGIFRNGQIPMLVDALHPDGARNRIEALCGAAARACWRGGRVEFEALGGAPADWGGVRPELLKLTSGTTAEPLAIKFTVSQLVADCDQILRTMGIGGGDLNYGLPAFSHSYGFSSLVTPLVCAGVPVVVASDALPRSILDGLERTGATVLPSSPPVFRALSGVDGSTSALRLAISAGAPLARAVACAFRSRFGVPVHAFYGASECGGICYDRTGEGGDDGFVGEPLDGVEVDALGSPADGCFVRIKSAAVGLGWHPSGPGDEQAPGSFQPADILQRVSQGWKVCGRASDFINVGGRKVNPSTIESALLKHPSVREAVIFGSKERGFAEAIGACIVADPAAPVDALRRHCAALLPGWQVPREIFLVDAIPHNSRGKISRRDLSEHFAEMRKREAS